MPVKPSHKYFPVFSSPKYLHEGPMPHPPPPSSVRNNMSECATVSPKALFYLLNKDVLLDVLTDKRKSILLYTARLSRADGPDSVQQRDQVF